MAHIFLQNCFTFCLGFILVISFVLRHSEASESETVWQTLHKMIRKKALQRIPSASEGNEGCKMLLRDSPLLQQMFTNLVPYIKIQIKVCSRFSCIPFTWDEEQRRIGISKSRWKLRFCKFQVIIHWIYTLAMLAYFVTPGSMKLNKMSNKLLGFVFLSCLIVTMFMQSVFWQKRTEAIALWKAFSDIEEYYIDRKDTHLSSYASYLILIEKTQ